MSGTAADTVEPKAVAPRGPIGQGLKARFLWFVFHGTRDTWCREEQGNRTQHPPVALERLGPESHHPWRGREGERAVCRPWPPVT